MAATGAMFLISIGSAIEQNQISQAQKGLAVKPSDIPDPTKNPNAPNAAKQQDQASYSAAQASQSQRRRALGAAGWGSTLLTGPQGDTKAPPVERKTLLGL
ncbi:MAG TPA: hypothetical protein VF787_03235 [Thermoanaerobaculia bacterium]